MFSNTTFNEILKPLNGGLFHNSKESSNSDKYTKGFSSWSHLVAMLHCQFHGCESLRSVCNSYNQHSYNHYHLRTEGLKRSTLSYANMHRSPRLFIELLNRLIPLASSRFVRKEANEIIRIIDSTPIPLRGKLLEACGSAYNGRTRGVKLHIEYDANSTLPTYYGITKSNVNDIIEAKGMPITKGATYVFDRAYFNYSWWDKLINEHQCRIITRRNASSPYTIEAETLYDNAVGVIADRVVTLSSKVGKETLPQPLRLITVALDPNGPVKRKSNNTNRPSRPQEIEIITNDLESSPQEIADIYRRRWEIELFFRWIKQHLKIKRFIGNSENGLVIQVLTAIIAYILLKLFHQKHHSTITVHECTEIVRTLLFHRKDTEHIIRKRRRLERLEYQHMQPTLNLGI